MDVNNDKIKDDMSVDVLDYSTTLYGVLNSIIEDKEIIKCI